MALGSLSVNTPGSRSRALLFSVTRFDQRLGLDGLTQSSSPFTGGLSNRLRLSCGLGRSQSRQSRSFQAAAAPRQLQAHRCSQTSDRLQLSEVVTVVASQSAEDPID